MNIKGPSRTFLSEVDRITGSIVDENLYNNVVFQASLLLNFMISHVIDL